MRRPGPRTALGPGCCRTEPGGTSASAPPMTSEPAAGRVEDHGHGADGGERDGVAEGVTGEVLGGGLEEPRVALLAQGQEPVLGRGGGEDACRPASRPWRRPRPPRRADRAWSARVATLGTPTSGSSRAAHRSPVEASSTARLPPAIPTTGLPGIAASSPSGTCIWAGSSGHDDAVGQVDADDRVAVLDDVEVGVGTGEDGAVELADGLVDAAVRPVVLAGDPDAAVVQVGPVSLVAVGLDGVRDDAAHGDGEREPGHQRSASALQVLPERHAVSLHRSASSTALWKPTGRPMEPKQREDVEQSRARSRTVGSSWITMVTQWGLSRQRKGPIG